MPLSVKTQPDRFEYKLKTRWVTLGDFKLEIECLEDLDKTIDALFVHLERGGNPALLEELCPYFGVIWPSALALSEYLVDSFSQRMCGARVIELGCGLALPAMVASKLGANVTAADFHPEVEFFLERNLAHNGILGVRYLRLDWLQDQLDHERYDYVIGSDVLYEKAHPAAVARVIASLLKESGVAVISDPARPYLQEFSTEMHKLGFVSATEVRRADDKEIFLIAFSRK